MFRTHVGRTRRVIPIVGDGKQISYGVSDTVVTFTSVVDSLCDALDIGVDVSGVGGAVGIVVAVGVTVVGCVIAGVGVVVIVVMCVAAVCLCRMCT